MDHVLLLDQSASMSSPPASVAAADKTLIAMLAAPGILTAGVGAGTSQLRELTCSDVQKVTLRSRPDVVVDEINRSR